MICVLVLATKELKQLTTKLESLLLQIGANEKESKSLIQKLSDAVERSASDVKNSNEDVKRSNADVASKLQLILAEFKSKTVDPELRRALAAVTISDSSAGVHWMSKRTRNLCLIVYQPLSRERTPQIQKSRR